MECIRSINNTIELCRQQRDTCIKKLTSVLDGATLKECIEMVKRTKEARHRKILEYQNSKDCAINRYGYSNMVNNG